MIQALLPFPNIDPVALHIWGPLEVRWYALSYIAGLVLAWWGIARVLRDKVLWAHPPFNGKPPATEDEIGDLVVWVTFGVILGGRLVASGTASEIRDMVDAMPAEIRVRCDAPRRLAEAVCGTAGAESLRFEGDDLIVVATRQPRALAERISRAAVEDRLAIQELTAEDRSLEGIFSRLVRLHRGGAP